MKRHNKIISNLFVNVWKKQKTKKYTYIICSVGILVEHQSFITVQDCLFIPIPLNWLVVYPVNLIQTRP